MWRLTGGSCRLWRQVHVFACVGGGCVVTTDTSACGAESDEECGQWLEAGLRRRRRLEGGENNRMLLETDPLHTYPLRPPHK